MKSPKSEIRCPKQIRISKSEKGGRRTPNAVERGDFSPLSAGDWSPPNTPTLRDMSRVSQSSAESQPSKTWRRWLVVCFFLLPAAFCLTARGQYSVNWWTVDGSGGTSTGGVYSVSGTIGQPDAGRMSGGNFTLEGGFWGIVAAIQTEGAPRLSIELTNGWVKVSWPAPATGWTLTETSRLTGAGSPLWPTVSAAQYQTNAGRIFILTAPQPLQNRYYQLRKP